jgi:competence protein ComK
MADLISVILLVVIFMNYVIRSTEGVMVFDQIKREYKTSLRKYIDELCIKNLSTFDGRQNASFSILKTKVNVPIFVNDKVLLFPTKSIRNYDCHYINFYSVLSVRKYDEDRTKIYFSDLSELVIDINISKIRRQLQKTRELLKNL